MTITKKYRIAFTEACGKPLDCQYCGYIGDYSRFVVAEMDPKKTKENCLQSNGWQNIHLLKVISQRTVKCSRRFFSRNGTEEQAQFVPLVDSWRQS